MFKIIFLPSHFHLPRFSAILSINIILNFAVFCYSSFIHWSVRNTVFQNTLASDFKTQLWQSGFTYHILPKPKGSFSNWNQATSTYEEVTTPFRNHHPYRTLLTEGPQALLARLGPLPLCSDSKRQSPWWGWPSHCPKDHLLPKEGTGINHSLKNCDHLYSYWGASQVVPVVKSPTARAGRPKRRGSGSWIWKIPWRTAWQPTPVFLLENPMGRGAWWAAVHGVAQSDMTESDLARTHTVT